MFNINPAGILELYTFQAAAFQFTLSVAGEVLVDTWYTLGMSRNGADVLLYKDGIDITDTAATHTNPLTSARKGLLGIRDDEASSPFDGEIEFLMVYNRALSTAEHLYITNNGWPQSESGLVLWLKIEDGSGATASDSSTYGSDGTITTATWVNGSMERPAGNSGTNDSRLTWGANENITLVYGEPINFATTSSALSGEGGYDVAEADMPAEWYGTAGNIINLPLYDMMLGISVDSGIPTQTLYVFFIIALCFAFMIAGFVMFNSVMASIVGVALGLGIGSAMTVVPMWIFFTFLILAIGIGYLKGRAVFG